MNEPLSVIVRLHTTISFETFLLHHILTPGDTEAQWKQSYQKHILIKRKELVNILHPGSGRSKSLGCQSG